MTSLLELTRNYQNIINQIIENGGELPDSLSEALGSLELSVPEKVDAYAVVLERLKAEETYLRQKASEFEAVARGCKNAQERLKDSLKQAALILKTDEIKGIDSRFKISESEPKLKVNSNDLEEGYFTEEQTIVTSKIPIESKIKFALEQGLEVKGASYQKTVTLRQYVNKSSGAKNAKRID